MPTIQKIFRDSTPALRFIGKRYFEVGGHWGEWFANGWFDAVETAMGGTDKITAIWENGGGYIGLERHKDGEPWQYWLGMFTPRRYPRPRGLRLCGFPRRHGTGYLLDLRQGERGSRPVRPVPRRHRGGGHDRLAGRRRSGVVL